MFILCYAVVNLLLLPQQWRFALIMSPFLSLSGGGLKWTLSIWLLRNQVALAIFAHSFLMELWWAQMDSDHRPHAYQACALTS